MSTILYIALKLVKVINEPNDWLNICHLVALDSIAFMLLLHWWQKRKA